MPDLDADVVREIDVVHHSDNGNHADDEQSRKVCRQQQPRQSLADLQFIRVEYIQHYEFSKGQSGMPKAIFCRSLTLIAAHGRQPCKYLHSEQGASIRSSTARSADNIFE